MKKETYKIPPGCKYVTVETSIEQNSIRITFGGDNQGEFYCKETGEIEALPEEGDMAIMWTDNQHSKAIISLLREIKVGDFELLFISCDGYAYKHAIRFRDKDQYLKILDCHER